ncbi:MAG: divalent-cation tolerance protein CutA [Planctomycetia bacterium]|nr:divalent-cation tolerance protein CutA [Planctomycetia bacterium]
MSDFIQIQITFPDEREAQNTSTMLVQQHFVACAQITGPIESVYHWQGKLEKSREWLVLAKCRATQFNAIVKTVAAAHSYECPQIVGVPLVNISPAYRAWLEEETK